MSFTAVDGSRFAAFGAWVVLLPLGLPMDAAAHGGVLVVRETCGISMRAGYDTGAPMAGAQITVYAPDDPARPWRSAKADERGAFAFVPEACEGRWTVQARQAGHGAIAHIDLVGEEAAVFSTDTSSSGANWLQRLIMAACVIWGCIGTALYFSRSGGA